MEKNGAQILLEILHEEGIDTLFGYPGGAVIPLYHELFQQVERFTHIRTAHEQGAVHAADGYARATGKLGVCFVTSGPGVTNTITGIATAYMDSAPLLVISGQVPTSLLGKDSFQEVDATGIAMPITKHTFLVKRMEDLEKTIRKAIKVAVSGRPGPVLVDIPKNLFTRTFEYPSHQPVDFEQHIPLVDQDKVKKASELINQSKKPIVYAGGGIRIAEASEALREFCMSKQIPIVNSLMSLGTFPRDHELSLGMVGMHGYPEANLAITHSDMIIAIGARFSDRVIGNPKDFAKGAKVVHVDFDFTEFSKNIDSDIDLCGDLNEILAGFIEHVDIKPRTEWLDEIRSYEEAPFVPEGDLYPEGIIKTVSENVGKEAMVVTDVGQHQMWTAQYYPFSHPRQFITSGGLGTMGFGLGAAIGTKMGHPKEPVVLFTGDGSFRMNSHEMATLCDYGIPVMIVLFNNEGLGMVRQWQKLFQNETYSETKIPQNVNYLKLAEAYGLEARSVKSLEELAVATRDFVSNQKAMFVECRIDKDEDVYPIVPPGESIDRYLNR